jgi:hypothetical protein
MEHNQNSDFAIGMMYSAIHSKFNKYVVGGKKNTNFTPKKKKRKKK